MLREILNRVCNGESLSRSEAKKVMITIMSDDESLGQIEKTAQISAFIGALRAKGESLDELSDNLAEVIDMLLEDGEPKLESEFVGIQTVQVD